MIWFCFQNSQPVQHAYGNGPTPKICSHGCDPTVTKRKPGPHNQKKWIKCFSRVQSFATINPKIKTKTGGRIIIFYFIYNNIFFLKISSFLPIPNYCLKSIIVVDWINMWLNFKSDKFKKKKKTGFESCVISMCDCFFCTWILDLPQNDSNKHHIITTAII